MPAGLDFSDLTDRVALSPAAVRALAILADAGDALRAEPFARGMWPDSPAWSRVYRCGPKGSHRGTGIILCAGGYLAKLARKGLVHDVSGFDEPRRYALTDQGLKNLQLYREAAGTST